MITATYTCPFQPTVSKATQQANMAFSPLDNGELEATGLTIASDVTSYDAPSRSFKRVVTFTETPEFLARFGTNAASRKSAVANLYSLKITERTRVPCSEEIVLS